MDKKVNKSIQIEVSNNKKIQLPIIESTIGPDVIDVRNLYKEYTKIPKERLEKINPHLYQLSYILNFNNQMMRFTLLQLGFIFLIYYFFLMNIMLVFLIISFITFLSEKFIILLP